MNTSQFKDNISNNINSLVAYTEQMSDTLKEMRNEINRYQYDDYEYIIEIERLLNDLQSTHKLSDMAIGGITVSLEHWKDKQK